MKLYLGVELTQAEIRELHAMERKNEYVNPYEHYGFHTGYGIEEREQFITPEHSVK